MSLQFTHIFGPLLVILAFLFFGKGMVNRTRGKDFRPWPVFVLLIIALGYRFWVPKETLVSAYSFVEADSNMFDMLLDRLTLVLMDFGIGMVIDAGYLKIRHQNSKLFWVPGVLALILSTAIYLFASVLDKVASGIRSNDTTEVAELLIELGPDDHIKEVSGILGKYGASHQRAFQFVDPETDAQLDGNDARNLSQYYAVFVEPHLIEPLSKELMGDRENIDHVAINHSFSLVPVPLSTETHPSNPSSFLANDPVITEQWYAQTLGYDAVHRWLQDHPPVRKARVAILDSGLDADHEDLSDILGGESAVDADNNGHGTHCAGLAAAHTHNAKGMASLNWQGKYIDLLGFQALSDAGIGTDRTIAQAIIDAANAHADVISLSLGGPTGLGGVPKAQQQAITYALKKGAIVVVAAGNANRNAKDFSPASAQGVITISALNQSLQKAPFSNTNMSLKMPLAAPGVDIVSTTPQSTYQIKSGTSMATPLVAGVLGLMRSLSPDISAEEAFNVLKDTGRILPDSRSVGPLIQPLPALQALTQSNL